jgi:prefoldin subunit 5
MLMIKELESKMVHLEDLIQKISSEILANVAYEKLPPIELWARSEDLVNAVRNLSEEIRDKMMLLRPERAPSIRRKFRAFLQPLNSFKETLQKPADPSEASKQALEHLRRAVTESQEFIEMVREILEKPSEGIIELLKLKEVYEAKEYISKVSVPETVYVKLEHLKRSMETLRLRISSLEQAIKDLLKQMDRFQEEASVFQQEQQETELS